MNMRSLALVVLLTTLNFGCTKSGTDGGLVRVSLVERGGVTETVSQPERLKRFEKVDFLEPQSYEQVVQFRRKEKNGPLSTVTTSYHPNGQVYQYLEGYNGAALGWYREWFPSGQLRIEAEVIGGLPEFTPKAQETWLFEGLSRAWDESGFLTAEFMYEKGLLEGVSKRYHVDGTVWKMEPYHQGKLDGEMLVMRSDGVLLESVQYQGGLRDGMSRRYWGPGLVASEESFDDGKLISAQYWLMDGSLVSSIVDGYGFKAKFARTGLFSLTEFRDGFAEGLVKEFDSNGSMARSYSIMNGELHGIEDLYYPSTSLSSGGPNRKMSISWQGGMIQGEVKTWYSNGTQESVREFSGNQKQGLCSAWYQDGSLMLIEEYAGNKLVRGRYMRRGDPMPVSEIKEGRGIATMFDSEGKFLHKISYYNGRPAVE